MYLNRANIIFNLRMPSMVLKHTVQATPTELRGPLLLVDHSLSYTGRYISAQIITAMTRFVSGVSLSPAWS